MAWMDGKLDKCQNTGVCKCGARGDRGVYAENDLIGNFCDKCFASYCLDYKSCSDYIRGFLAAGNGTAERAAELASVFSGVDIRAAKYAALQVMSEQKEN